MASVTIGWSYTQYSDVDRVLLCRSTTLNSEDQFETNLNEGIQGFLSILFDEPSSNYVDGTEYTFVDNTAVADEAYFYCIAVKAPGASGLYKVGSTTADASSETVTYDTPLGTTAVGRILVNASSAGNSLPLFCGTTFEPYKGYAHNGNVGNNPNLYIDYSNRIGISSTAPSVADRPIPGTLVELTWKENKLNPRSTGWDGSWVFDTERYPLINTADFYSHAVWHLTEVSADYARYELTYLSGNPQSGHLQTSDITQDTADPNKNKFTGFDGVEYTFNSFHAPVFWQSIGTTGAETNVATAMRYLTNYEVADRISEHLSPETLDLTANAPFYRSLATGGWSGDDAQGSWVDPKDIRRTHGTWTPSLVGVQSQKSFQVIGSVNPC